jgi:membrane-associated protein
MEFLIQLFHIIENSNEFLGNVVSEYGAIVYIFLFLIIFAETGLVVTPFLPGDSLLFAAGAIAATGSLNIFVLIGLFLFASILGDTVNYWIGKYSGEKLLDKFPRLIRKKHLDKTHEFFEKYGAKTIVLCRFVPIVRTLAPFVAGAGAMTYDKFMKFNIMGALLWVLLLVPAGYFFGNAPFVKDNFSLVIIAIIIISFFPPVFEYLRERRKKLPTEPFSH